MANIVDSDQTAPLGAVWSGSTLFAHVFLLCFLELLWHTTMIQKSPSFVKEKCVSSQKRTGNIRSATTSRETDENIGFSF